MKFFKACFVFVIGFTLLGVVFLVLWIKIPYGDSRYSRDLLGRIYYNTTSECLDICFIQTYEKVAGASSVGFFALNLDYAQDGKNVYNSSVKLLV